jgi:hypothetical protein
VSNDSDVKDVGSDLRLAYTFKVKDDQCLRNKSRNCINVQLIDSPEETDQWISGHIAWPN